MTTTIKDLPTKRLAVMEHHGDHLKLSNTWDKLTSWAKAQPINLKKKPKETFAYAYNDPREVQTDEFRFDVALTVPDDFKLSDQVIERVLPSGRYAVATHKGSRFNIGDTINELYRDWLPASGEELADLPLIFCFLNLDHEVAETELLTEVRVLLK